MKRLSILLAFVANALLVACSTWPMHGSGSGGLGASRVGMGAMMGDQNAMCELNRRLMAAPTPEERQAMLDQYMAGMSPETRQRHLQMMRQRCR